MKCEQCNCETYIVHINEKHEKICNTCYQKSEKSNGIVPGSNYENDKNY